MLYLDNSATTRPLDEVVDAIVEVMKVHYGNPSSLYRLGMEAEQLLNQSRTVIAQSLGVRPEWVVFTSGGTESNNLAIKGTAYSYRSRGKHLITTEIEHASVYECFRQLEEEGFRVTYLKPDSSGAVSVKAVEKALTPDTILVSIMHVNNETGVIQPIREIGEMLKNHPRILFHVDAVQSVGKIPLVPEGWGIDLLSVSAHKLHGPKGVGLLLKREGLKLRPLLAGGGQEFGIRSGTENVPLIVGMAKALRIAMEKRAEHMDKLYALRDALIARLRDIPGIRLNGVQERGKVAPHIINFSIPGLKSEVVVHALEQHGIYVSAGSACSSGDEKPSRVLLAMGLSEAEASSAIRVSLSPQLTEADMDRFIQALETVIKTLKPATKKGEIG
jgi:cysteine desulfurase